MPETNKIHGIIYMIRNKINNKIYIGQTVNKRGFKGRYSYEGVGIERVYLSNKNLYEKGYSGYNMHLIKSIEKYGFDAFEIDEEFDIAYSQEELNKLEYMYIEIYKTRDPKYGYNHRYGGSNGKLSKSTINKITSKIKGIKRSKEFKENDRIKHLGKLNAMYGKKGELSPNYGKHISEEQKQKIREAMTGGNNPKAKAVYCEEFKEIRLSANEWARELNIPKYGIHKCCKNTLKQTHGYHFRYATEEEIKEYKLKHEYKGSDL